MRFAQILVVYGLILGVSRVEAQLPPRQVAYLQTSDLRAGPHEGLPAPAPSADSETILQGERMFQDACTLCHEAEKALEQTKSYDEWLDVIREMAQKEDAEIPVASFVPIAAYLASLSPPAAKEMGGIGMGRGPAGKVDQSEEGAPQARPRFDPADVSRGQSAFNSSCTTCHDAQRSLSKRKSRAGWLATVRRMSRMDGADIAASEVGFIATYLASLNSSADDGGGARGDDTDSSGADYEAAVSDALGLGSGLNVSGTFSTLWLGGNDNLENPNFFADAWVRFDWQPDGPVRARVTTCTSCHSDQTGGGGFTLELVEAAATLDLLYGLRQKDKRPEHCKLGIEAEIKAGRFVVPFGAYHAMSHPGVYRTVTNPLMYNMGRQVNVDSRRPPVLPMPYSDEGVDLRVLVPICDDWRLTLNGFGVNGLQGGGSGVNFTSSRAYADNNRHAGYGGRATVGNKKVRFGGSVMAGRLEDEGAAELNYHLAGADATARLWRDDVRLYFEYALRRNDSIFGQRQISYGTVSEVEVLLLDRPNISALFRYDTLEHRDFFGETSIERFTWGISSPVAGGLLIANHEHWNFPTDNVADVDVLGIRWVATF